MFNYSMKTAAPSALRPFPQIQAQRQAEARQNEAAEGVEGEIGGSLEVGTAAKEVDGFVGEGREGGEAAQETRDGEGLEPLATQAPFHEAEKQANAKATEEVDDVRAPGEVVAQKWAEARDTSQRQPAPTPPPRKTSKRSCIRRSYRKLCRKIDMRGKEIGETVQGAIVHEAQRDRDFAEPSSVPCHLRLEHNIDLLIGDHADSNKEFADFHAHCATSVHSFHAYMQ